MSNIASKMLLNIGRINFMVILIHIDWLKVVCEFCTTEISFEIRAQKV